MACRKLVSWHEFELAIGVWKNITSLQPDMLAVTQKGKWTMAPDAELAAAQGRLEELRGRNYRIDMTRGKPSPEQVSLSDGMLTILRPEDCFGEGGDDVWPDAESEE